MFSKRKNRKRQDPPVNEQAVHAIPDQDALLHEAYMLIRHLHGCYPETANDQELSLRLSCLLGHVFTPARVERVLEALQRPYCASVITESGQLTSDTEFKLALIKQALVPDGLAPRA